MFSLAPDRIVLGPKEAITTTMTGLAAKAGQVGDDVHWVVLGAGQGRAECVRAYCIRVTLFWHNCAICWSTSHPNFVQYNAGV